MSEKQYLVVGTGITGRAVAQFLFDKKRPFVIWDTRASPPNLDSITTDFPGVPCYCGVLPDEIEAQIDVLVVSPGLPLNTPVVARALVEGKEVINDIELFAQQNIKPIIAVTGSNGKSTVVTLLGEMAKACGLTPAVMGNIGSPVLSYLDQDYDVAIMELSSFQLMTTQTLSPDVACILNISEDHLDWHGTMAHYINAKQRIYMNAKHKVCNKVDTITHPGSGDGVFFQGSLTHPIESNIQAALTIASCMGWDINACEQAVEHFESLPHRLQRVININGVDWYNDSKATNIVSAAAGIQAIGAAVPGKLVLIMGGAAKTTDFTDLIIPVQQYAKHVILIGQAKELLKHALGDIVTCEYQDTLEQAVVCAHAHASPGDAVILSPACTSWDMFKNFGERGDLFIDCVNAL